jgi:hypothetical protein
MKSAAKVSQHESRNFEIAKTRVKRGIKKMGTSVKNCELTQMARVLAENRFLPRIHSEG